MHTRGFIKHSYALTIFLLTLSVFCIGPSLAQVSSKDYKAADFSITHCTGIRTASQPKRNFVLVSGRQLESILKNKVYTVYALLNDHQAIIRKADALHFKGNAITIELIEDGWKIAGDDLALWQAMSDAATLQLLAGIDDSLHFVESLAQGLKKQVIRIDGQSHVAVISIPKSELPDLLTNNSIISVQLMNARKAKPEQALSRFDLTSPNGPLAQQQFPSVNGKGINISLKEDLFDSTDLDLRNRYFFNSLSSKITSSHATIMATMLGGSGNSYRTGKGIAYKSTLTSTTYANLIPESIDYYTSQNITVQNHSYGVGVETNYATDAAAYDLSTWQDTTLLHIFSAGNAGLETPTSGRYNGLTNYATITGSFKMSKNSLAVAAIDSFNVAESRSSRGPANDGRIKPEIGTYGEDGTSGAAALTSGTAALVQQVVKTQTGKTPAASLTKAILINGTKDIGAEGPDYITGYGLLDAYQSVKIADTRSYSIGTATANSKWDLHFNVPAGTGKLAVTLCWSDTAGSPLSFKSIQNNLDLLLIAPNGDTILPWKLNDYPSLDSLLLPAKRGIDILNTVEHVSLKTPAAGNYTIEVVGKSLVTSQQRFSIAWHVEPKDSLYFTNPLATHQVDASTGVLIRWKQFFSSSQSGTVSIRNISSNSLQVLANNVQLEKEYLLWKPNNNESFRAQLVMTVNGKDFVSDTFLVHLPASMHVGFICNDSALLYWNQVPKTKSYSVFAMGDTTMQLLGTTTDTVWVMAGDKIKSRYFAVTPNIENRDGTRSYAIDIAQQGIACYLKNFLALYNGDSAQLVLNLGTLYNVKQVEFQKKTPAGFSVLQLFTNPITTAFNYFDSKLLLGSNTYRAAIVLANGVTIYSEEETAYSTNPNYFTVFPNPVVKGTAVKIISKYNDLAYATLFDMTGRKIQEIALDDLVTFMNTNNLQSGMYLVQISGANNQVLQVAKLVIL